MDAPYPIMETPLPKNTEKNIINIDLSYNNKKYCLIINTINEETIKFISKNKNINENEKYEKEFNLEDFKNMNKYFKMFDNINELEKDLIPLIKENNVEIFNITKNEFKLSLKVLTRIDNIVLINLKKVEINDKENIAILFNNFEELKQKNEIKDKKINELEKKVTLILKEMEEKYKRIQSLEKDLNDFKINFNKFKEEIKLQNIKQTYANINPSGKNIESKLNNIMTTKNNNFKNILNNSNIFENEEEIKFLLNNISNNHNNLKILYNSKNEGENEEKLLNVYPDKNDIIFLIKTDKLKRFGGYAQEFFEKNEFIKKDINAFLFCLNKKAIYKSKGNSLSIWRGFNTLDSINFGSGCDLKIFHKFLNKQSWTRQTEDYDYKTEIFALNGQENFNISFLEIYQVY